MHRLYERLKKDQYGVNAVNKKIAELCRGKTMISHLDHSEELDFILTHSSFPLMNF